MEAVALKALAKAPTARYASAKDLAADILHWLADEPVSAWSEPLQVRARRWAHRHRTATTVAAALLIVGAVGLAISNVLVSRQRERAEANFQVARQAVDDMYTQVAEEWLAEQSQLEPLQKEFLQKALHFYERAAAVSGGDPTLRREAAKAQRRVGEIQQRLGDMKAAEAAYRHALETLGQLSAVDPNHPEYRYEAAYVHNRLGWLLHQTGRSGEDDLRSAVDLLEPLATENPDFAVYRRELSLSHSTLGLRYAAHGRFREAELQHRTALRLRAALAAADPDAYGSAVSSSLLNLGLVLKRVGRYAEAEDALRKAVAESEKLLVQSPRKPAARNGLAIDLDELANLIAFRGRPEDAASLLQQADALAEALAADFPAVVDYQNTYTSIRRDLANLQQSSGRLADAEPAYVRAIEHGRSLVAAYVEIPQYRRTLAVHHNNLAGLRRTQGRSDEAEADFRLSLELVERLVAEVPLVLDYQSLLGQFLTNQAVYLRATGRFADAEPLFRRAAAILEALAAAHPDAPEVRFQLAGTLAQTGELMNVLKRPADADAALRRGAELALRLTAEHPDIPSFAQTAGLIQIDLAELALDRGEVGRANEHAQSAAGHIEKAVTATPKSLAHRGPLLRSYGLLARLQIRSGDDRAATESANRLAETAASAMERYNVACYLGLCVSATQDAPWPEAKRAEVADALAGQAMTALRRAIVDGYRNIRLIRKDPDLDPLRQRRDFKELLAELEAMEKP